MIRAYRATDLEGLLESWAAASAVAHPFLSPEFLVQERRMRKLQEENRQLRKRIAELEAMLKKNK